MIPDYQIKSMPNCLQFFSPPLLSPNALKRVNAMVVLDLIIYQLNFTKRHVIFPYKLGSCLIYGSRPQLLRFSRRVLRVIQLITDLFHLPALLVNYLSLVTGIKGELNLYNKWQSDDLFHIVINENHPRGNRF